MNFTLYQTSFFIILSPAFDSRTQATNIMCRKNFLQTLLGQVDEIWCRLKITIIVNQRHKQFLIFAEIL